MPVFMARAAGSTLGLGDIDRVLEVNVPGIFLCAREAIKRMSTKHGGIGGSIVNVSSGSAKLGIRMMGCSMRHRKGPSTV